MAASPWPMPGVSTMTRSWAGGPAGGHDVVDVVRDLAVAPGGQRADEHVGAVDGVHADAVAEQRATGPPAGGVDGHDGDAELVLVVEAEAPDQLVGERRLARAAGAGDAEHGNGAAAGGPGAARPARPRRGPPWMAVTARARRRGRRPAGRRPEAGASAARSMSQASTIVLTIRARPRRWPSARARRCGRRRSSWSWAISSSTMTPPPPPNTLMSGRPSAGGGRRGSVKYSMWPPW